MLKLLPRRVDRLRPRQRIQPPSLNAMQQLAWLTIRRHQIEPPPRNMHRGIEPQYPVSQRIPLMMVIEQPPIHTRLTQRSLYRLNLHTSPHTAVYPQQKGPRTRGPFIIKQTLRAFTVMV